jgi:hypothetical protein
MPRRRRAKAYKFGGLEVKVPRAILRSYGPRGKPQLQPKIGGDEGIRTLGLCLAKAALSQLSYIPLIFGGAAVIVAIYHSPVNL